MFLICVHYEATDSILYTACSTRQHMIHSIRHALDSQWLSVKLLLIHREISNSIEHHKSQYPVENGIILRLL